MRHGTRRLRGEARRLAGLRLEILERLRRRDARLEERRELTPATTVISSIAVAATTFTSTPLERATASGATPATQMSSVPTPMPGSSPGRIRR